MSDELITIDEYQLVVHDPGGRMGDLAAIIVEAVRHAVAEQGRTVYGSPPEFDIAVAPKGRRTLDANTIPTQIVIRMTTT
jgi:hypothetical protein